MTEHTDISDSKLQGGAVPEVIFKEEKEEKWILEECKTDKADIFLKECIDIQNAKECSTSSAPLITPAPIRSETIGNPGLSPERGKSFSCDQCSFFSTSARGLKHHCSLIHKTLSNKGSTKLGAFECVLCGKCFSRKENLYKHKMRMHISKDFPCKQCPYIGKCKEGLSRHVEYFHLNRRQFQNSSYKCKICRKQFISQYSLKEHMFTHGNVKFLKCDLCDFTTNYRNSLHHHNVSKHGNLDGFPNRQVFKCSHCPKIFASRGTFDLHSSLHMTKRLRFWCVQCGKDFSNQKSLAQHMLHWIHTSAVEQWHQCPVHKCQFVFQNYRTLKRHVKQHATRSFPTCSDCGKIFIFKKQLKHHRDLEHTEKCSFCSFVASGERSKKNLNKHVKSVHASEQCTICDNIFSTEHPEDCMEMKCKFCPFIASGKRFKLALSKHIKSTHGKESKVSLKCKMCSILFDSEIAYDHHLITQHIHKHQKCFECAKCKTVLKTASGLERHLKNTNCTTKESSKKQKSSLSHSRKKTSFDMTSSLEDPQTFRCDGCNEQFVKKRVLQKHQKYCAHL